MQKKLRHSKFKNTGILFELLTKQITADILAGRDVSLAKDLLFKYFRENTELGREYNMYNFLMNEKISDEVHAERLLSVILDQRKRLKHKKLAEEKYNLIKEMRETYPLDDFLKAPIKNYKVLASIYKLFEDSISTDTKFDINEIFQAKNCIIENIITVKSPDFKSDDDLLEFYKTQSEVIRLLSYKFLIEGFNKKYSVLDDDQKNILREYINNVSNTNSLGIFVNSKIDYIKKELSEVSSKISDNDVVKIKISEIVKQLDNSKCTKNTVRDNQIMVLLLSYELLKEVKQVLSTSNQK